MIKKTDMIKSLPTKILADQLQDNVHIKKEKLIISFPIIPIEEEADKIVDKLAAKKYKTISIPIPNKKCHKKI